MVCYGSSLRRITFSCSATPRRAVAQKHQVRLERTAHEFTNLVPALSCKVDRLVVSDVVGDVIMCVLGASKLWVTGVARSEARALTLIVFSALVHCETSGSIARSHWNCATANPCPCTNSRLRCWISSSSTFSLRAFPCSPLSSSRGTRPQIPSSSFLCVCVGVVVVARRRGQPLKLRVLHRRNVCRTTIPVFQFEFDFTTTMFIVLFFAAFALVVLGITGAAVFVNGGQCWAFVHSFVLSPPTRAFV